MADSSMRCPRDSEPLTAAQIDAAGAQLAAYQCRQCTGHWMEPDQLKQVEQAIDIRLLEWRHLPGVETQGKLLFCPRCRPRLLMDKVLSKRDQRVVMDVCPGCKGVWLDYGELEAIQSKGLLAALADVMGFIARS